MILKPDLHTVYKVVGNCQIETDIYLPVTPASSEVILRPAIINIHGGGFILGHSRMVNEDQIKDCLLRGWIVVVPNHRLCPQVDISKGPVQDIRDLLQWIRDGELDKIIAQETLSTIQCNLEKIVAFGTSAGGTLALCLGFGIEKPIAAILDFYGPCNFTSPFWTSKLLPMAERLPNFPPEFLDKVYHEDPVPTKGGISLEGGATRGPDFTNPRQAFAMTQIANGTLMNTCFPSKDFDKIDPIRNVGPQFPPCCIVHGEIDTMVPMSLSRDLFKMLKRNGNEVSMIEIPGEGHTFAGQMVKGSRTWDLQRKGFDFLEKMLKLDVQS